MMKEYKKKIEKNDIVDVLRYLYLSNRYSTLLNLHKDDESVSPELKLDWADKYIKNSVDYNIKSLEIFNKNEIPIKFMNRYNFDLEEGRLIYWIRENVKC